MALTPLFFRLITASVANLTAINALIPEKLRPLFRPGYAADVLEFDQKNQPSFSNRLIVHTF